MLSPLISREPDVHQHPNLRVIEGALIDMAQLHLSHDADIFTREMRESGFLFNGPTLIEHIKRDDSGHIYSDIQLQMTLYIAPREKRAGQQEGNPETRDFQDVNDESKKIYEISHMFEMLKTEGLHLKSRSSVLASEIIRYYKDRNIYLPELLRDNQKDKAAHSDLKCYGFSIDAAHAGKIVTKLEQAGVDIAYRRIDRTLPAERDTTQRWLEDEVSFWDTTARDEAISRLGQENSLFNELLEPDPVNRMIRVNVPQEINHIRDYMHGLKSNAGPVLGMIEQEYEGAAGYQPSVERSNPRDDSSAPQLVFYVSAIGSGELRNERSEQLAAQFRDLAKNTAIKVSSVLAPAISPQWEEMQKIVVDGSIAGPVVDTFARRGMQINWKDGLQREDLGNQPSPIKSLFRNPLAPENHIHIPGDEVENIVFVCQNAKAKTR